MILGLGSDLVDIRRIEKVLARHGDRFIQRIFTQMTQRIASEIIQFLSGRSLSDNEFNHKNNRLDRWIFTEHLGGLDPYLGASLFMKIPLVGIGAPARAFLPQVAEILKTHLILPDHYEVANAVGTVVGKVLVHQEADVFPCIEGASVTGYFARVNSQQVKFELFEQAANYARQALVRLLKDEAASAGAGDVEITSDEKRGWDGMLTISAWATGKPGI